MKHIEPSWNIDQIKLLDIEQQPYPSIGFESESGVNLEQYKQLMSAGVLRELPSCFDKDQLESEFDWIDHKAYAIHKMLPGTILPLHRDKYSYYSTRFDIKDFDNIVRVIVFLEDHRIGHVLQIEGTEVKEWRAGDYVSWRGKKAHLAANFGNSDRYTLQVTGIANQI
jgi:hypothetical protein|tara:strand:+ start:774 stop:1277 length:504 start_codon:yes stop_codon:yes gene_type:complete